MLDVQGLEAGYGAIPVLHGVALTVGAGEIVAVLGSNGVGKTTLNRVLSGLIPIKAGQISFDGTNLRGADHAAIVRAGLIHVPEGRRIFPNLSVRDNLLLGAAVRGRPQRKRTMQQVLQTFPRLGQRLKQLAGTLSGGEQQMLAIGRGLMAMPRLLILDEPSLGLSPRLVEDLFALIKRLNAEGLSILLVEQNVVQSLAVASRGYVMQQGLMTLSGPSARLAADPALRTAYLGL